MRENTKREGKKGGKQEKDGDGNGRADAAR